MITSITCLRKLLLGLLLSLLIVSIYSQNTKSGSKYYSWVDYMDNTSSKKGHLIDLADLHVTYLPKSQYKGWMAGNGSLGVKIPIGTIESLKFRKSNRVGNGMLVGGVFGGVALGLLALTSNSECDPGSFCLFKFSDGTAFLIGFIPGGLVGMIIGSAIGNSKISIPLDGNLNSYKSQRERIKEFILHPG